MLDMPYFMEKEEWYTFDVKTKKYVLTERAPKEAKKSLDEFYKELKEENDGRR